MKPTGYILLVLSLVIASSGGLLALTPARTAFATDGNSFGAGPTSGLIVALFAAAGVAAALGWVIIRFGGAGYTETNASPTEVTPSVQGLGEALLFHTPPLLQRGVTTVAYAPTGDGRVVRRRYNGADRTTTYDIAPTHPGDDGFYWAREPAPAGDWQAPDTADRRRFELD
jgi:hypothetical protein